MRGLIRSASCVFAGSFAIAGAAHAAAPVAASFDGVAISSPDRGGRAVDLSQAFVLPPLAYGPPDTSRETISNLVSSIALVDGIDLQVGYHVDLAGRVVPTGTVNAPVENLFLSAATRNGPYASLASGGDFVGATAALADDLHLSVGSASLAPGYSTYSRDAASSLARVGSGANPFSLRAATSLLGGVSWDIGKWGGIGVTASQTSERGGVLGTAVAGVNATTSAVDFSAHVQLGAGWVTSASYSEGITQLDLKPGFSPSLAGDSLRTRSYGIAIAKNGLFGDDALGLAVPRRRAGAADQRVLPDEFRRPERREFRLAAVARQNQVLTDRTSNAPRVWALPQRLCFAKTRTISSHQRKDFPWPGRNMFS